MEEEHGYALNDLILNDECNLTTMNFKTVYVIS